MDRPPSKLRPVVKGLLAIISALVAVLWLVIAIRYAVGFISPDSGDSPGSVGHLFVALFYFILAGPFAAIAFVLAAPLVSNNPKYRNADR